MLLYLSKNSLKFLIVWKNLFISIWGLFLKSTDVIFYFSLQITALKIKYNPFAKAFQDAKDR